MSRSLIACAIEAGTTTVVRAKNPEPSTCTITDVLTVRYGLDGLLGPGGAKAAAKIAKTLRKWEGEPVALSVSPGELPLLPAWFPAGAPEELREQLCRMEAGLFFRQPDTWGWTHMPVADAREYPKGLDARVIMFYPLELRRVIEEAIGTRHPVERFGLHVEAIAGLVGGSDEPVAVLELEEGYASFMVSRMGRVEYYRCWPVKNPGEREFFAITELGASEIDSVSVTGLAADGASVRRIASGASRTIDPLVIPHRIGMEGKSNNRTPATGLARAVGTALAAFAERP
jgi:hypothetical protein